jgi:hypothetical protein
MSDEELEARYAQLLPKVLEHHTEEREDDQRLGRALVGKSLQDLTADEGEGAGGLAPARPLSRDGPGASLRCLRRPL